MANGYNRKRITRSKQTLLEQRAQELFRNLVAVNERLEKYNLPHIYDINQLANVLMTKFVNICDFVEGRIKFYKNIYHLSWSINMGKKFPKRKAKSLNVDHFLIHCTHIV
jgi:hypothetical protein